MGTLFVAGLIACVIIVFLLHRRQEPEIPLHVAVKEGKVDMAALLLDEGADIEGRNKDDWTPLHVAAQKGKTDMVTLLLDRGADIEALDEDNWTPLHFATFQGKADVVSLLLRKGANAKAKAKTRNGETALDIEEEIGKLKDTKAYNELLEHTSSR